MGVELSGLQNWLRPAVELSLSLMQAVSGGTVQSYDGAYDLRVKGGVRPVITSTYRSIAEQQKLYDARASNPYPVNRPGDSAHNYGLGFDSDVPEAWMPTWIQVRRYLGFRVPDNDEVHAEVPDWRRLI